MKIGDHGLGEHIRLLAPLFGLITAVFVLRLVLDAAGAPSGLVRACSITVFGAVAVLLAVLLIHIRRFGSYANVLVSAFLLTAWEQLLIAGAIFFSVLTRTQNVYTAPEYSPGRLMDPWRHIAGHLIFGNLSGTLFGTLMGCLILWMLRVLVPVESRR